MDPRPAQPLSPLARSIVRYLTEAVDYPFCQLTDVRRENDWDIIEMVLEPELDQDRKVAIEHREPVRLIFPSAQDKVSPFVVSTRQDFPHGHVHTSLVRRVDGPTLCIWEEAWHDLSATLNGQALVERIRSWFSRMADGSLHDADQAPEPLIPASAHTLVLPAGPLPDQLHIVGAQEVAGRVAIIADANPPKGEIANLRFSLFTLTAEAQVHRGFTARPKHLRELTVRLEEMGADLKGNLGAWLKDPAQMNVASANKLLLMVVIPVRKAEDEDIEIYEVWAYTSLMTLAEIGGELGVTDTSGLSGATTTTQILGAPVGEMPAASLDNWRVVWRLDRRTARVFSGLDRLRDLELVAVGAGAIGSNVVLGAAKAGLGRWTIIDDDIVLPHNTVRQAQDNHGVGFSKAEVLCDQANALLSETDHAPIVADVLDPRARAPEIDAALEAADLMIDFSASPAVVGWMADKRMKRAASFFFGPDGRDLVMLVEDAARETTLDAVEAQYFAAVASDGRLAGHLGAARVDRIRYANACQDLTRPLPTWQVQMLSALAAGRLSLVVDEEDAAVTVWRLDPESGGVAVVKTDVAPVRRLADGDWKVVLSEAALSTVRGLRQAALPSETGGVLLGTFDLVRRVVHVVAVLPAPPDSRQSPTHFIRGARDLRPKIEAMATASAGRLQYLGEWHSHPDQAAARPSADDEEVFTYLSAHMGPTGTPFLMLICGSDEAWLRGGWQGCEPIEGVLPHHAI